MSHPYLSRVGHPHMLAAFNCSNPNACTRSYSIDLPKLVQHIQGTGVRTDLTLISFRSDVTYLDPVTAAHLSMLYLYKYFRCILKSAGLLQHFRSSNISSPHQPYKGNLGCYILKLTPGHLNRRFRKRLPYRYGWPMHATRVKPLYSHFPHTAIHCCSWIFCKAATRTCTKTLGSQDIP